MRGSGDISVVQCNLEQLQFALYTVAARKIPGVQLNNVKLEFSLLTTPPDLSLGYQVAVQVHGDDLAERYHYTIKHVYCGGFSSGIEELGQRLYEPEELRKLAESVVSSW